MNRNVSNFRLSGVEQAVLDRRMALMAQGVTLEPFDVKTAEGAERFKRVTFDVGEFDLQ